MFLKTGTEKPLILDFHNVSVVLARPLSSPKLKTLVELISTEVNANWPASHAKTNATCMDTKKLSITSTTPPTRSAPLKLNCAA